MAFERVYMVWEIYDGPRSGLARYENLPHYFDCELDRVYGGYVDVYRLWPIDVRFLSIASERWVLYRRWELRYHSGEAPLKTHPGHRGQDARYDQLQDQIDRYLQALGQRGR